MSETRDVKVKVVVLSRSIYGSIRSDNDYEPDSGDYILAIGTPQGYLPEGPNLGKELAGGPAYDRRQ